MKKYVVTGGPCTGKTSLLKELSNRGYTTVGESARHVIETETKLHSENMSYDPVLPWTDLYGFQKKVIETQIQQENSENKELIFLDRSLIDGLAYSRLGNISIEDLVNPLIQDANYTKVFFLDRLGFYEKDGSRSESEEEAIAVHNKLFETYKEMGLDLVIVPNIGIQQRADFIEKYIFFDNQHNNNLHLSDYQEIESRIINQYSSG